MTTVRNTCRVCEGSLTPVLSLGPQFVSDFLSPDQADGEVVPLELVICQVCRLLQLKHTFHATSFYRNYWYKSGTNRMMTLALADITQKAEELMHLQPGSTVLDIGCNDGTLLNSYRTEKLFRIGFDPARNLARFSKKITDVTVVDFFTARKFQTDTSLADRRPMVVTSIAMFYDLEEPRQFVADVKAVMDPEGLWIIQMSYLPLMLRANAFDNICHEHLEYYSLGTIEYLLELHGLSVVDVEENDVNGGSFRLYVRHTDAEPTRLGDASYREQAGQRVELMRASELREELADMATYRRFAARVEEIKRQVTDFIRQAVGDGKRVYAYGASTKGNTLLQYFGLDHSLISGIAERNPDKFGLRTVGTRIPILSEQEVRELQPEYLLVLPWHFMSEFVDREKAYLESGGRFVVPLPEFKIV